MSKIEGQRGRLVPVVMDGLTLEQKCRQLCEVKELPKDMRSWEEQLKEESNGRYHYNADTGVLFTVETTEFDPEGFMDMKRNHDGSYEFITAFYSGGAGLAEVLNSGIRRIS